MTYQAPLSDIGFTLKYGAELALALEEGLYGDLTMDVVDAVLAEAGRIAGEVIAPLNRVGDRYGTPFKDGAVTTPPGWKEAYTVWRTGGWNGLAAPTEWGGQALPQLVNAACVEMWNAASMAFGVGPLLTMAAIDALQAHGSETLKRTYLEKLVSGEWMGTMQLTEPQAGSDVGALRTRAERAGNGSYRITGQKIFITYGEHDLTDNIIHFVLARLPDAPPGTRGISLFLVPKFLLKADGSLGARNDVRAHSIEHKLGIHGSPTCTMIFGDAGGATGISDRRRECRHGVHVHDDEPRTACGWPPRRRRRRMCHATGARLRARTPARPRGGNAGGAIVSDHRAPRCPAHAAHHARSHSGRACHLLRDRHGARSRRTQRGRRGTQGRA